MIRERPAALHPITRPAICYQWKKEGITEKNLKVIGKKNSVKEEKRNRNKEENKILEIGKQEIIRNNIENIK
ncbi:MAG: hypothetical protein K5776_08795 [Lachnospiraceae bacterium]|nr:hypothetical protein [Lachnospiraceae bacterium]